MNVIIVGAGNIGYVSAETISEVYDVLIIENDADVAEAAKSRLNVSVLHEDGTNPKILRYAIETHHADIIVSALHGDDSNLFVCMMAKRIKPSIKTVSSITNPDFMIETSSEGFEGVDVIISPEIITANKMYKLAVMENAIDYEFIDSLGLAMTIFEVRPEHEIVGRVVMNLDIPDQCSVFAIYRDDDIFLSTDTMEIHPGDKICVLGSDEAMTEFNGMIGVEDVAREFMILGGSIVGMNLARLLSADSKKRYVKIIDRDPLVCRNLAKTLSGVIVINEDFTDPSVQIAENVFKADCTISTSHLDDTNLLMCMSAQKYNSRKVITRYFKKEYEDIFKFTGLETIIGYYRIISNEITKSTISDEMAIMRMRNYNELFFIHNIDDESKVLDRYLGDLNIPEGIRIVAIVRDGETIYPRMDTKLLTGDRAIVFTNLSRESEIAKVFGKNYASEM